MRKLSFILLFSLLFVHCSKKEDTSSSIALETISAEKQSFTSIEIPLLKGPYQDNGATPWFAPINISGQTLKFVLDSGNNFVWATSTQCTTPACLEAGRIRFDPSKSATFLWVDKNPRTLNWGPWGNMSANVGQDKFNIPDVFTELQKFYLAISYQGERFEELDWDGGIGFPSASAYADPEVGFFMDNLITQGRLDPNNAIVAYETDPLTKQGIATIGAWDPTKVDLDSKLTITFEQSPLTGLEYLWTSALEQWAVNGTSIAQNIQFCFDTGSSRFKGDAGTLSSTINLIDQFYNEHGYFPAIDMYIGKDKQGNTGHIQISPEMYRVKIEKGHNADHVVTAITTGLDVKNTIIGGSVLMDHLYAVFVYENITNDAKEQSLRASEIWLFNKTEGLKPIIN